MHDLEPCFLMYTDLFLLLCHDRSAQRPHCNVDLVADGATPFMQISFRLQTRHPASAYLALIGAVQTLEQTHAKGKLYTTCLGG